jgi:hypothetical protein
MGMHTTEEHVSNQTEVKNMDMVEERLSYQMEVEGMDMVGKHMVVDREERLSN